MDLIADFLLVAGAVCAGIYCFVLSKRLKALQEAEGGVGHAVASLSEHVEELKTSVSAAHLAASQSNQSLESLTDRAEQAAVRLELMVASMHDIPEIDGSRKPLEMASSEQPVFSSRVAR